ncbi:hypothetical protein JDS78_02095 [Bacillus cereus group sp. N17]|uniref:hypothetical protein n=1 Tax=Bacillus cereus group sp. N17 TaxID=2794589 RepID=UPI0018F49B6C|nr:hypothetical protein [Bacillus cereus group sp. N17]MBJ8039057.1 hypothetical protein [Bacillus cereus group sp. N17]
MDIESVLKSLIPLGSALLGGYITYRMNRAKEIKEVAKKQLESLFELQKINFKILGIFNELELKLSVYVSSPVVIEGYDGITVTDKIQKCSDELVELYVVSLAHAIHMKIDEFEFVKQAHDETRNYYLAVTERNDNNSKIYSEKNIMALQAASKKVEILQRSLIEKEKSYVESYMKKYNKNL